MGADISERLDLHAEDAAVFAKGHFDQFHMRPAMASCLVAFRPRLPPLDRRFQLLIRGKNRKHFTAVSLCPTHDPQLFRQPDLFPIYYGYPEVPLIELSGNAPREVPASVNDTGYVAITSAQSLVERGFGVSVAEDALFWKTHKRVAARVYTNADIRR